MRWVSEIVSGLYFSVGVEGRDYVNIDVVLVRVILLVLAVDFCFIRGRV